MDRFASFDGLGIAYEITGTGPDVLLLHGFAADHRINWVRPGVVGALAAAGRRVIAYDARGHGQSDKPHDPRAYEGDAMKRDAIALLDHLGVEHVDVVGYSMGALVSTRLVPEEPRARTCVLGGIGGRSRRGRVLSPEARAAIGDALTARRAGTARPAARAFRVFADRTGADRDALAAVVRSDTLGVPKALDAIKVPTMVIAGDNDVQIGRASWRERV